MSQLTHMRQRIKAIKTIKKITHAMRLISMSTHSRMKHQEEPIKLYQQKIMELFASARALSPLYHNPTLEPKQPLNKHPLVILIGSQKGLCGSFNSNLFQLFNLQILNQKTKPSIITVGKQATQYIHKQKLGTLISFYDTFGLHNLLTIADSLLQEITQAKKQYSSVTLFSNTAPSFFMQRPKAEQIIPAQLSPNTAKHPEYEFEQSSHKILDYLSEQYLLSHIQHALFQSLIAEHSARFVSMDSSTRNAETLLEQMQLNYNKLRQAKITRELTELSSFFLT
ncbi:MAG: ATP synthase F1 subunit gamma [Candidatus Dependentiae bacterium]